MRNLIYVVAGARPNSVKIAPLVRPPTKEADSFSHQIIHTGQHYERDTLLGPQPHMAFLNPWKDTAPVLTVTDLAAKRTVAYLGDCIAK